MNCKKCGFPLKDGDSFCTNCGAPVEKSSTYIPDELMKKEEIPTIKEEIKQETSNVSKFGFDSFGVTENDSQVKTQTTSMINGSPFEEIKSTIPTIDTIVSTPVEETPKPVSSGDTIASLPIEEAPKPVSPINTVSNIPAEEVKGTISPIDTISSPIEEIKDPMQAINNNITSTPISSNQNNNTINTYSSSDKKKGSLLPIIIVVAIILVGVIGLFAGKMLFDDNDNNKDNNSNINQNVSKTIKINFEGFTLSLPVDYMYEVKDNTLYLGDEEGTWVTELYIIDGSYNNVLSNKAMLKTQLEKSGYKASEAAVKNLGSIDWITSEVSVGGQNGIIGYSRATATKVFGALGYTTENNFDYDTLEKLGKVLSTFEYSEQSTNIESGFDKNIIESAIPKE
jgi:uncharacterized Zn finger protein (UPF0148 family)